MKIYILTDLEGPAMVSRWSQTRVDMSPEKAVAMKLLTWEVNACVDGILDVDPDADIVVWDGHGSGGIDILEFHPRARLIARGPIRAPYFLDESYDALFFVGQHAMAGTPSAPLCHTYSSKTVEYYQLNGVPVGEFACRAYMAGGLGVPVVFIAGDDKAVTEARTVVPDIIGVETKQGLDIELALHLSPAASQERIRVGAAEAVRRIGHVRPAIISPLYRFEVKVREGCGIDGYIRRGARAIDHRTCVFETDDYLSLPV